MSVTRQAVSNWEREKTLPDVYMLKTIAAVFNMTLDEFMENAKEPEVKMPKTPGLLLAASLAVVLLYLLAGGASAHLFADLAIEMIIIAVFCQGFLHLYFAGAVKTGEFSMLAGYDNNVRYRTQEVKKLLVQMDIHIGCVSLGALLLIFAGAFMEKGRGETLSVYVVLA